jgi:hypothetical protein
LRFESLQFGLLLLELRALTIKIRLLLLELRALLLERCQECLNLSLGRPLLCRGLRSISGNPRRRNGHTQTDRYKYCPGCARHW